MPDWRGRHDYLVLTSRGAFSLGLIGGARLCRGRRSRVAAPRGAFCHAFVVVAGAVGADLGVDLGADLCDWCK